MSRVRFLFGICLLLALAACSRRVPGTGAAQSAGNAGAIRSNNLGVAEMNRGRPVQALELFRQYRPANMSHLVLSHLSKNNNCPDLVQQLFNKHAGNVKIIIAGRYAETELFELKPQEVRELVKTRVIVKAEQLQFCFT